MKRILYSDYTRELNRVPNTKVFILYIRLLVCTTLTLAYFKNHAYLLSIVHTRGQKFTGLA